MYVEERECLKTHGRITAAVVVLKVSETQAKTFLDDTRSPHTVVNSGSSRSHLADILRAFRRLSIRYHPDKREIGRSVSPYFPDPGHPHPSDYAGRKPFMMTCSLDRLLAAGVTPNLNRRSRERLGVHPWNDPWNQQMSWILGEGVLS